MNKHEPIRHHYVPRFLLKPFCFEDTKIHYYDKNTGEFREASWEEAIGLCAKKFLELKEIFFFDYRSIVLRHIYYF